MKHEVLPKVVEILMSGRERVAKGWCQNHFRVERPLIFGGDLFCSFSAIDHDVRANVYLRAAVPNGWRSSVIDYNDAPGRTQAEILALFDRAIELALK